MRKIPLWGGAVAIGLSGCSLINPHGTMGEEGKIWCNERYRTSTGLKPEQEAIAEKGYMYAMAAALVLQSDDPKDLEARAHWFARPSRLQVMDRPKRLKSGFEVGVFTLESVLPGKRDEVVIAFTGSNDRQDWLSTNLNPFQSKQYDEAVAYTKRILARPEVAGKKVVLSGISLGGGLAVHVLKTSGLDSQIDEVWAINPSPKIYAPKPASDEMKQKTWLVYSDDEILAWSRTPFMTVILPGAGPIEAGHIAIYDLIKSNRIYAHFRWGVARQMLWVADVKMAKGTMSASTEPFDILKCSAFKACPAYYQNMAYVESSCPAMPKEVNLEL